MAVASSQIAQEWRLRVAADHPQTDAPQQESVVQWLLGDDPERYDQFSPEALQVTRQAMEYRYRILQQRYWSVSPESGYHRLVKRLSSLFLVRNKVRTWIALSRDRRRTVVDVVQEVLQEMLQSDRHLARQSTWIGQCTDNPRLRNRLMLASIEEYCLRPIRNQPLITYRFVNYLRRTQKGGMTQVPTGELIRLISDEVSTEEDEGSMSLLDLEALSVYQDQQAVTEQQLQRDQVKNQFSAYLSRTLGNEAAQWLDLHLRGYSQDLIAQRMGVPTQQVYRLREKISYHAIRIFAAKENPELVFGWLKTSLTEHNFGLTPSEWEEFWQARTSEQQVLLERLKARREITEIAQELQLKPKQVQALWSQLYLEAQTLRNQKRM